MIIIILKKRDNNKSLLDKWINLNELETCSI